MVLVPERARDVEMLNRYMVRTQAQVLPTGEGVMVDIMREGQVVTRYVRNYPWFWATFCPFRFQGREYALYCPLPDEIRVMELPRGMDLGGTPLQSPDGPLCPMDFYVPYDPERGLYGQVGFAVCAGGHTNRPLIVYLDLQRAPQGRVRLSQALGYLEMPDKPLHEAIDLSSYTPQDPVVRILGWSYYAMETPSSSSQTIPPSTLLPFRP